MSFGSYPKWVQAENESGITVWNEAEETAYFRKFEKHVSATMNSSTVKIDFTSKPVQNKGKYNGYHGKRTY